MAENAAAASQSQEITEEAFESFFLKHYRRVYEVLYRLTGQNAEAEDLTVEAFVRFLRRGPAASNDEASRWLYCVAVRLGYNSLRSSKRRGQYEQKAALYIAARQEQHDPARELERSSQQKRVHAVLRRMPRRSAQLLVLHHSGFSYKEIAQALGIPVTSIGTLLSRAQKEFERLYLHGG